MEKILGEIVRWGDTPLHEGKVIHLYTHTDLQSKNPTEVLLIARADGEICHVPTFQLRGFSVDAKIEVGIVKGGAIIPQGEYHSLQDALKFNPSEIIGSVLDSLDKKDYPTYGIMIVTRYGSLRNCILYKWNFDTKNWEMKQLT